MDIYKLNRKTSLRQRKRKDHAKKEFQDANQSDQFESNTQHDGWSYMSFPSPFKASNMSPSGLNNIQTRKDTKLYSPKSLGYIPAGSASNLSIKHDKSRPSLHSSLLEVSLSNKMDMQVISDAKCLAKSRGSVRRSREIQDRKLWRKSAIGIGEEEMSRRVVYTDFGMIDNPMQLEDHAESMQPYHKDDR